MSAAISVVQFVLFLFMMALIGRMILGFVMSFSRDWRPAGAMLVVTESIFTVTDPPLRALRKIIPPLQLGQIRLDLAFLVLFLGCSILSNTLNYFVP